MNGVDAALVIVLFVALTFGLAVGGIIAARNPAYWVATAKLVLEAILPKVVEFVARRNSPEIELRMQECIRKGGEWDNFRKRCRH